MQREVIRGRGGGRGEEAKNKGKEVMRVGRGEEGGGGRRNLAGGRRKGRDRKMRR